MNIEILTLFPEAFRSFLTTSLVSKALDNHLFSVNLVNIRDFADPPHYHVDDTPYGGGAGMVLRPEPLARAIESVKTRLPLAPVILLSAAGFRFNQTKAREISSWPAVILICGRYEGIDQRIVDLFVDQEISLGDFVLMGGEVAAMAVLEASLRLIPGVLGNSESIQNESFADLETKSLEAPHYTRPAEFRGLKVPEVLLSGNHAEIEKWRSKESLRLTRERKD